MKKKTVMKLMICCILFSSPLFARDLSIDQAVTEAVNKSAKILSATLDIKSAQIDVDGKYSSFYPTVNVGLTVSRKNEPTNQGPVTTHFTSLTGLVNASFNFNPAMITSLQATALQLESKNISLEKAKSELELQIKKLYYGILVQQSALDVLQKNIDYMNETLKNTKAAYENGDIPELSVLQLQSQLSSQKASLEKSMSGIVAQKRTLAFLIGSEDITESINLTTAIPTIFNDDLSNYSVEKAIAQSIDLESANVGIKILEVNKKALHESTYIPSISLSASYMPTAIDITNFDTYAFDKLYDAGSLSASVAFNITNLLPGSSTQTAMKKLDVSVEQLEQGNQSIRSSIILAYNSNIEAIKEAKRQMILSKDSIDLAQQSFDLTSLSYENGDTSFSDLQSAQLSVSNAKLGLLQSQYTYLSTLLDLENQCTR